MMLAHRSRVSFLTSMLLMLLLVAGHGAAWCPVLCCVPPTVRGVDACVCGRRRYLSPEVFDGVSDYVITKPQLCGKLVTITVSGHKIMGYPLRVRNERYHRYALMFNVGMVFDEGADTRAYQGVLRKLGNTFHTMETESSFLLDPEKKVRFGVAGWRCRPLTRHTARR